MLLKWRHIPFRMFAIVCQWHKHPDSVRIIKEMRATASQPATVHTRKKLLLVEDDDAVLASLRLVLNADYEIYSASTIQTGIEFFGRLNPALVVLDLRLPDGDGLEVLRAIKARRPNAPVMILTGYASMRTVEEALRLGAADYLHKPFDGHKLKARVRQLTSPEFADPPKETPAPGGCVPVPEKRLAELESKAMASSIFLHDAANPVTVALSATQLLCEEMETAPGKYSAEMHDACDLLSSAVGLLSGLFEQGAAIECVRHLEPSEVSLRRIADLAVSMVQLEAKKSQVDISVQLQDGNARVFVSRFALARVLLNLLRNAIAAVQPHTGKVVLSAMIVNEFAEFAVLDNGPGIPPKLMGRIFDAHFTTKAKGDGLGLYICKRLVEVMHGTLSVRNVPQHGCCFSVRIPREL